MEAISKRTGSKKQDPWGKIKENGSVQAKERKIEGKHASILNMHKRRLHRGKNKLLFHSCAQGTEEALMASGEVLG